MTTTGFWPVKSNLKSVIDYADNPDKTTEHRYVDDDLYAALRYAENDEKTDQRVYVAGINCSAEYAYQEMAAIQKRFGNRGSVVAYHGYQSFASGEVTPEEAFEIGKETARAMWGDKYQVLVTVHLNTDNIHCHFVVNPVSFVDGRKYHNKIAEHRRLREVSDRICLEHEKSVLENSSFYGGEKNAYWIHKKGRKTHRDQLKEDVEYCLHVSHGFDGFIKQLRSLGYDIDTVRMSVRAKGWQRSVRLSNIGFPDEVIRRRLEDNLNSPDVLSLWNNNLPYKPKVFPMENELKKLEFSLEHAFDPATVIVDTLFLIVITIFKIMAELSEVKLLSPDLRHEARNIKDYLMDYHLLRKEGIRTMPDLQAKTSSTREEISQLEQLRSKADNKRRRARSPEERTSAKRERAIITQHITPLRKKLRHLERICEKTPHLYELLSQEHNLERKAYQRYRDQRSRW